MKQLFNRVEHRHEAKPPSPFPTTASILSKHARGDSQRSQRLYGLAVPLRQAHSIEILASGFA
jgi:hypothetical protein